MSQDEAIEPDEVSVDPETASGEAARVEDEVHEDEHGPASLDEKSESGTAVDTAEKVVVDDSVLNALTVDDVLAATVAERDEFKDHLIRLQADFDNYRKRIRNELTEAGDKALGRFVDGLLPVLDAVDAARAHAQITADVDHVAGLLLDLLEKQGLARVGAEGDVFDPTCHEAVLHEAGDDDLQTVAQLLRAGWIWRGRVLRPAMVKVVGG